MTVGPTAVANCDGGLGAVHLQEEVLLQFMQGSPKRGGACLEIVIRLGECWGSDSDDDRYDCMGLCGPNCQLESPGLCSNWSLNCLRHDVCSYYYNSRGGLFDLSCGYAFAQAEKDYSTDCLSDKKCALKDFNTYFQVCASSTSSSRFARYSIGEPVLQSRLI